MRILEDVSQSIYVRCHMTMHSYGCDELSENIRNELRKRSLKTPNPSGIHDFVIEQLEEDLWKPEETKK